MMHENIIAFQIGLAIGVVLGWLNNYYYKKNLALTANSHQNEKIFGEWYSIKPTKRL
jgi:hypothetical protein